MISHEQTEFISSKFSTITQFVHERSFDLLDPLEIGYLVDQVIGQYGLKFRYNVPLKENLIWFFYPLEVDVSAGSIISPPSPPMLNSKWNQCLTGLIYSLLTLLLSAVSLLQCFLLHHPFIG